MQDNISLSQGMNAVVEKAEVLVSKPVIAPKPAPKSVERRTISKVTVFYHAGCTDGWCSAYLLKKFYPSAELVPVSYGQAPPEVSGGLLIIADFSYPKDVLLDLKSKVDEIVVLDHHKTAEQELKDLDFCTFDMSESGASLVSRYIKKLDPKSIEPWFVQYVKDRDLWTWALPESRAISAVIGTYANTIEAWDALDKAKISEIIPIGKGILEAQKQTIKRIWSNGNEASYEGHKIYIVNSSCHQSEIGEYGYTEFDYVFVVIYFITKDGKINVSLRAKDFDVGREAKRYGGGGHRLSSGLTFNTLEDLKREFNR